MEHFVWEIDPIIVKWGPIQIRYYGICFAFVLLTGIAMLHRHMRRLGYPEEIYLSAFYYLTAFLLIGARLGHCLFYESGRYLSNPLEILYIWKGGLSSHGATIGLILGAIFYAKLKRIPILIMGDTISWGAALASTFVRVGNFFNHEIIGRATDLPWAVHFKYGWDQGKVARHPSQIYEAMIGTGVLIVLFIIDRKLGRRLPRGLLWGVFMTLYFPARFMVEYVKEYQTLQSSSALTMGQYLSIPAFLLGLFILFLAYGERGRITGELPPDGYKPKKAGKGRKR